MGLLTKVGTGVRGFQLGQPPVMCPQPQQYFANRLFDGDLAGFPKLDHLRNQFKGY